MPDTAVASTTPATSAPTDGNSSPSLIATSTASRTNYADNVSGLTSALSKTSSTPTPGQAVSYDNKGNVMNQPDGKGGFYSGPISSAPGTLYNVPDGKGGYYSGPASGAPVTPAPRSKHCKRKIGTCCSSSKHGQ